MSFVKMWHIQCDCCNTWEDTMCETQAMAKKELRRVGWSFGNKDKCPKCNKRK